VISERMGRPLSPAGVFLLISGLFVAWYHIKRSAGIVDSMSGWETFPRLLVDILLGEIVLLISAILTQTRPVLGARAGVGVLVGLVILRRDVVERDPSITFLRPPAGELSPGTIRRVAA
jgi:hypothetical protein